MWAERESAQGRAEILSRYDTRYDGPGALRRIMVAGMARLRYPGSPVEQLLLAPQDLRTADPSFSMEISNGQFGLVGIAAELEGQSPFAIRPPSEAWARELHGFGWLRHLRAAESDVAHMQAKTLVAQWLRLHRTTQGFAWRPEIVGRRVISWLCNSVVVLDAEDGAGYEDFLNALTVQLRYLSASYSATPDGVPRLTTLIALVYAGLCVAEQLPLAERYLKYLSRELNRQIPAEGGHISRNPMALVDILLDLLPLRRCFIARDKAAPEAISQAIERAMNGLQFFRMPDGALARFNGTGATPADALATVLAYDDVERRPSMYGACASYARLKRGDSLMIGDFGAAPALGLSSEAGAGCLSFELMVRDMPLIVNCGAPTADYGAWSDYTRSTEAHSTLQVGEDSSGEFIGLSHAASPEALVQLSGPPNATGGVGEERGAIELFGSHDGYRAKHGLRHSRQILMASTGHLISGKDTLTPAKGESAGEGRGVAFAIRFHLHPDVAAEQLEDGRGVLLRLSDGEIWKMTSNAPEVSLEESFYFGGERGPIASIQVVLSGTARLNRETRTIWSLERIGIRAAGEEDAAGHRADERGEGLGEGGDGSGPAQAAEAS